MKGERSESPWILEPTLDLGSIEEVAKLRAFGASLGRTVFLVFGLKRLETRIVHPSGGSSTRIVFPEGQTYRVVEIDGTSVRLDVTIENEPFNIHYVQPLGDQILLACARSRYGGPDEADRNGRIYDRDGSWVGEILLGDGIEDVQTTRGGSIWTSYFDEGVIGNYGWSEPLGRSGLVAWDRAGRKTFEFGQGRGPIVDCYALNVAGEDDVWCCYYPDFPLVQLRGGQVVGEWQAPVSGSEAFVVGRGHVLFWGEYGAPSKVALGRLEERGRIRLLRSRTAVDEEGEPIVPVAIAGRSDTFFLVSEAGKLYRVNVADA